MALAIKFEAMLREGIVRDQTELARLARVTQPRMTQILALNFLAPDIQERVLCLINEDGAAVSEKELRPVAAQPLWSKQREMWVAL